MTLNGHNTQYSKKIEHGCMVASSHNDAHLTNFLEGEFLDEQVRAIKKLGDQITRLKRAGPEGLGEYIFDKDLSS